MEKDMFEQIMAKQRDKAMLTQDKVKAGTTEYNFNIIILFEESVQVSIPQEFKVLSEEEIIIKYPYATRPELVYASDNGSVSLTLDLTDTEVSDDDLPVILLGMRSSVKQLNPANTFYDMMMEYNMGWFDFLSYAIDGKLYNMMFVVNIDNKLLLGSFSCPHEEKDNYNLFAQRIIKSIQIAEREVE